MRNFLRNLIGSFVRKRIDKALGTDEDDNQDDENEDWSEWEESETDWKKNEKLIRNFDEAADLDEERLRWLAFGAILTNSQHDATRSLESIYQKGFHRGSLKKLWGCHDADAVRKKITRFLNEDTGRIDAVYNVLKLHKTYEAFAHAYPELASDEEKKDTYKSFYAVRASIMEIIEEEYEEGYFDEKTFTDVETLAAWNYARAANVARLGFNAGFIDEDEAWQHLKTISEHAEKQYKDWHEYGIAFIFGRFLAWDEDVETFVTGIVDELWDFDESIWGDVDIQES